MGLFGPGLQGKGVGAGAGFAQCVGADGVRSQARQPAFLLSLSAPFP